MKAKSLYCLVTLILIAAVCVMAVLCLKIDVLRAESRIRFPPFDDVPKEQWAKLAGKRIFFGHHSVGYGIVEGIKDIVRETDFVRLNVIETSAAEDFEQPVFAHGRIGKNMEPMSKIQSFMDIMLGAVGNKADIAFFKFCYVDITRGSDPQEIFDRYKASVEDLKMRCPGTKFLHVTVPIQSGPIGAKRILKSVVKRLIGKPGVVEDNLKREHYNNLLRETCSKTDYVFDLALAQSVDSDGRQCYALRGAEKVPLMAPEYTDDGGHLNKLGRKQVARQLLITLAGIADGSYVALE